MEKSHNWSIRSLKKFNEIIDKKKQKLYGIIQGGIYKDLRKISTEFINENNFFGNAIGGSLGKNKSQMNDIIEYVTEITNNAKPTHLLGIGSIKDIFQGVKNGINT